MRENRGVHQSPDRHLPNLRGIRLDNSPGPEEHIRRGLDAITGGGVSETESFPGFTIASEKRGGYPTPATRFAGWTVRGRKNSVSPTSRIRGAKNYFRDVSR